MTTENPKRTVLPEASESQMLQNSSSENILSAGFEITVPPHQLTSLIDEMQGGTLDTEVESIGNSSKIQSMQLLRVQVEDVLSTLTDKERKAIESRFGLSDGRQKSTKEVAGELGVSKSTARRRTNSAISKLRDADGAQRIKDFFQE